MLVRLLIFILVEIHFLDSGKKFLIKTGHKSNKDRRDKLPEDLHKDYMADIEIKTVNAGDPVELKCVSPRKISACFFSKTDENLYYKIQPKSRFQNNRLQCLCDVSLSK